MALSQEGVKFSDYVGSLTQATNDDMVAGNSTIFKTQSGMKKLDRSLIASEEEVKNIFSIECDLNKVVNALSICKANSAWSKTTGERVNTSGFYSSEKIKLSFFKNIILSKTFYSAVVFKSDGSFYAITNGSTSINTDDYSEYDYIGFNFLPANVNENEISFFSEDDHLDFSKVEKICYPDFVDRKRWIYNRSTGAFIYYGNSSATKKISLKDVEYISLTKTPVSVLFWKNDGSFRGIDGSFLSNSFLNVANYSEYEKVAFNFSNDDLFDLVIKIKKKNTEKKVNDQGYYFKPNPKDVGNLDSSDSWGNCSLMTSEEFVNSMYEPLRTKYPNYITRKNIGKDASGIYNMWAYEFTPEGGFDYTVYLQSGVHSMYEKQAYCGLAILMNLIASSSESDRYEPLLCMIRQKIRFIVVPIVNVWNVSETALHNKDNSHSSPSTVNFNYNEVNLNRNWFNSNPEQEIVNVKNLLQEYEDIVFGFDCHTDPEGNPGWGSYLLEYANDSPSYFANRLKRVCSFLYNKNKLAYPENFGSTSLLYKAFEGESKDYPASSASWKYYAMGQSETYQKQNINNTFAEGFYQTFGILGATLEHGARKFGSNCDNDEMVAAVELFANHIIEQVRCNVNIEKEIYKT